MPVARRAVTPASSRHRDKAGKMPALRLEAALMAAPRIVMLASSRHRSAGPDRWRKSSLGVLISTIGSDHPVAQGATPPHLRRGAVKTPLLIQEGRRDRAGGGYPQQTGCL